MQWLAVALGGALGALCRYGVALALPHTPGRFPLATFSMNVLGSFLIGVAFVIIVEKAALPLIWRQFFMVGLLGALTTFSTFSLESLQFLHTGHWKLAVIYAVTSVCGCVLAVTLAYSMTNKIV